MCDVKKYIILGGVNGAGYLTLMFFVSLSLTN